MTEKHERSCRKNRDREDKDLDVTASVYDEELIDDEDSKQPSSVCRAEKSLGILTQRFVELLQRARGGVVDLNIVSILGVCIFEFLFDF